MNSSDAWRIPAGLLALSAIGLAAGTQALTEGIGRALFGTGELAGDLAKAAGWLVNLAVAEWIIRRPGPRGRRLPRIPAVAEGLEARR